MTYKAHYMKLYFLLALGYIDIFGKLGNVADENNNITRVWGTKKQAHLWRNTNYIQLGTILVINMTVIIVRYVF